MHTRDRLHTGRHVACSVLALIASALCSVCAGPAAGTDAATERPLPPVPHGESAFVSGGTGAGDGTWFHASGQGFTIVCDARGITLDTWANDRVLNPSREDGNGRTRAEPSARRSGRVVRIDFDGGVAASVGGLDPLPGRVHEYRGKEPAAWRTDLIAYRAVRCADVWPGVDLVYSLDESGLVCRTETTSAGSGRVPRFVVDRGAPGPVAPAEHDVLVLPDGSVRFRGPSGSRNAARPERLDDPSSLAWSTFLGGSAEDLGWSLAVAEDGHVYVTGVTFSSSFPTTPGAYDRVYSGLGDVFVSKLSPDGSTLVWSTFLGGSAMNFDYGYDLALASDASPFITGYTWSTDFPTTPGAYDPTHNGLVDAFVARLDPRTGLLVWSTFLGGEAHDIGYSIDSDTEGNPTVAGRTLSAFFPVTPGAYDDSPNGEEDAFVSKLGASGTALLWSTFVGGTAYDGASAIEVLPSDEVIVAGSTSSGDYPGGSYAGGLYDAFVSRLSPDGSSMVWSRLLGGEGADFGNDLAIAGATSDLLLCGATSSPDFPATPGAFDEVYSVDDDAYVARLSSATGSIVWATFLGGTDPVYETAFGVVADPRGRPIVAGSTPSRDFPVTADGFDTTHNGASDVFVVVLEADGSDLVWGTFLGSEGDDYGWGLGCDAAGNPVVTGVAGGASFPTTAGAFDPSYNGDLSDVFVSRLRTPLDPAGTEPGTPDPTGRELRIVPEPWTGGTVRIDFELPEAGAVKVDIVDSAGRSVWRLATAPLPAGPARLSWNGRDQGGRIVPAGRYHVRLDGGSRRQTVALTCVR